MCSLGDNGLVVGTSTIALPASLPAPIPPLIGGQQVQAETQGNIVIAGTTISTGRPGVTISGTPVSLGHNGLVVGASTFATADSSSNPPLPTVAGQRIEQAANDDAVVAGTMLLPNAPATIISGTPISLGSAGLVVGSSTYALPEPVSAAENPIGLQTLVPVGLGSSTSDTTTTCLTLSNGEIVADGEKSLMGLGAVIMSAFRGIESGRSMLGKAKSSSVSIVTTVLESATTTLSTGSDSVTTVTVTLLSNGVRDRHNSKHPAVVGIGFGFLVFAL